MKMYACLFRFRLEFHLQPKVKLIFIQIPFNHVNILGQYGWVSWVQCSAKLNDNNDTKYCFVFYKLPSKPDLFIQIGPIRSALCFEFTQKSELLHNSVCCTMYFDYILDIIPYLSIYPKIPRMIGPKSIHMFNI